MDPLFHLALIWIAVYFSVFLADKTRLTPVLYFLALGSLMVNTGILPREPEPFIRGFADFGIIMVMFALGFEENPKKFIKSIKISWGIALFGAIAPFVTTYFITDYFWHDTKISIMCALAMTATAVSLTMLSLKNLNLQKSRTATCIMTSAILDDVAALVLVAILLPLASGNAALTPGDIALITGKAVLFFIIVTATGLWLFPHDMSSRWAKIPLIGSYGIKHILAIAGGQCATLTVLLIAIMSGIIAHYFGLHPAIGAYMAGLILNKEYFYFANPVDANCHETTKKIIDDAAFSWIGPVFFVVLGAQIVFDWGILMSIIPETLILVSALFVTQTLSAGLAAKYTGGLSWQESVMVGFGMLGRAELAFVVINIAYVQYSILTTEAFYVLMTAAFLLNITVPITITLWKPYFLGEKKLFKGANL